MNAIQSRGITFSNTVIDNVVYKSASSSKGDLDIGLIERYIDATRLSEIIEDVNKAIAGKYEMIEDPDISLDVDIVFITENGIEIFDYEGINIVKTIPLQDFKELAVAWRDFLLKPPLNYSKV